MKVVIATRDPGLRGWYLAALEDMSGRQSRHEAVSGLAIYLHETYTGDQMLEPHSPELKAESGTRTQSVHSKECSSPTTHISHIQFLVGRPDLPALVRQTTEEDGVSVGVVVCGPSSMTHNVSEAASVAQTSILAGRSGCARELWLHRENFS